MDSKKTVRLCAAALAFVLLCGCAGNSGLNGSEAVSVTDNSTSSPRTEPVSSETTAASSEEQSVFATIDTDEPTAVTTEATDSAGTEQSPPTIEQSGDNTEPAPEPTAEPTAEIQPAGEPVIADPAAVTQTTAATTAQTAPPEPVEAVIPDVQLPKSPGVETAANEKAVLDYSNASQGYISVNRKSSGKFMKLRLICGDKVYDHDVAPGKTEYFPLSCGSGSYTAQLYEQTEGTKAAKVLEQSFDAAITADTLPFLYPNKYVDFNGQSAAVKKGAELCAGKSGTIEKLAAVFGWITDNVTYDKQLAATVQEGYVPDPDAVLAKKSGICYDYASLFAAMTRSQGIPTRLVIGYASPDIYHAWNEVYTEESGWVTPELLLSKHGYNLLDSTFYAGYTDKTKAADYISNGGNYSALYYY